MNKNYRFYTKEFDAVSKRKVNKLKQKYLFVYEVKLTCLRQTKTNQSLSMTTPGGNLSRNR